MASKVQRSSTADESSAKRKKRQVTLKTLERWQRENDKDLQTLVWLRYDPVDDDSSTVDTVWCGLCCQFKSRIEGKKHLSKAWIEGSGNLKLSNVNDHAHSDQHKIAMSLFRSERLQSTGESALQHAPIARSLLSLDAQTSEQLQRKI